MDRDLCLDVPAGFDDSDADAQVHPIARLFFQGKTNAEVLGKAYQWVGEHNVLVQDLSWEYMDDEEYPCALALYFVFELDLEDD